MGWRLIQKTGFKEHPLEHGRYARIINDTKPLGPAPVPRPSKQIPDEITIHVIHEYKEIDNGN